MWLYPVPALVSLALWVYIFFTGPVAGMLFSVGFLLVSVAAYYLFVGRNRTHGKGDIQSRLSPLSVPPASSAP
jgi:hypothetical protein